MKQLRWLAAGVVGACVALLVGFKVEITSSNWPRITLPEWLFYQAPQSHFPIDLPTYSARYWAVAGFLIGALWMVLRQRD